MTTTTTMLSVAAAIVACCVAVGGAPYYGSDVGAFKTHAHDVQGTVYAVDDRTIYIKGFTYDGEGPDAFFWAGSTSKPDTTGFIIPDEKGKKSPLKEYRNEDLLLRLPSGKTLRDIKWIAVWCRKFTANFGDVFLPKSLSIPTPVEIGPLPTFEHGVSSGPVMVVDTHTLLVPDFTYDGKGPAAYFWVSKGSRQHPRGIRLADENGSLSPLPKYTGKTLVISLPPDFSVHDVDWFGVWCEEARADFGSVRIPSALVVPPSPRTLGIELEYKLNCEVLRDDLGFEVRWIMDGEDIVMQMVAKLERGEYMAFGLSKNDSHSAMEKADAIVAWMDKAGKGHAVDYHLATKEQCVGSRGSCPDVKLPDGRESVTLLNAAQVNGYTMVTVKRPQVGMDERYDQHVYSDGPQAIVWAIGPLNEKNEVSYHGGMRSEGDVYIDFARSPQWNCPQPAEPDQPPASPPSPPPAKQQPDPSRSGDRKKASETTVSKAWSVPPIVCPADRTLRVQIGPTGGKKGAKAITGREGWGLAWYVNGRLLPEITLERGKTYTFVVEGGNDENNPARTHPFYITDDPEGGLEHKTPKERKKQKVFAGVFEDRRGKLTPSGKGRLCEWKLPAGIEAESFDTFDEFQENLELKCERGKPGRFSFKPDSRTPDTLYYQCFTHRHIGWKIHVVDSCEGRLRHEASVQHVSNVTFNSLALKRGGGGAKEDTSSNEKKQYFFTTTPSTSSFSSESQRGGVTKSVSIDGDTPIPTEKKQRFFTTTSTPKPRPVTMEAFHLGDVVYPHQQRYYSQNTFLQPSPPRATTTNRRPPQVSELKDTLQWWNDKNQQQTSNQRPREQTTSTSNQRQRDQIPNQRPRVQTSTSNQRPRVQASTSNQHPRDSLPASNQRPRDSLSASNQRPRDSLSASNQRPRDQTTSSSRPREQDYKASATTHQQRSRTQQNHAFPHGLRPQEHKATTGHGPRGPQQDHHLSQATTTIHHRRPLHGHRGDHVASASTHQKQQMVPVLLLSADHQRPSGQTNRDLVPLVVKNGALRQVLSMLNGQSRLQKSVVHQDHYGGDHHQLSLVRSKRSADHHHDHDDKKKKKKKKKSGAAYHLMAPSLFALVVFLSLVY